MMKEKTSNRRPRVIKLIQLDRSKAQQSDIYEIKMLKELEHISKQKTERLKRAINSVERRASTPSEEVGPLNKQVHLEKKNGLKKGKIGYSSATKNEQLILTSKRGQRMAGKLRNCDNCFTTWSVVWEYAHSNKGQVRLCRLCKSAAFNRSFHRIDALDMVKFKKKEE